MARITPSELDAALLAAFLALGLPRPRAALCARVVTESTADGVLSHGAAMVGGFADRVRRGLVDVRAELRRLSHAGAVERWDGGSGVGIWNAAKCTERAVALARRRGLGCVGLRNTSHWFRAGTYARQAAAAGCAFLCWTNTVPNMPAWGARAKSVGNNPLALALPHPRTPVVLDVAMSQFALGRLSLMARSGTTLPVPGGLDRDGELSTDPRAILDGGSPLPIGFWKGSGLALCLDLLAVYLSGGKSTAELARLAEERDVSQVFIAFAPPRRVDPALWDRVVDDALTAFHAAEPRVPGERPRYPGEESAARRARSETEGIELDDGLWEAIRGIAAAS